MSSGRQSAAGALARATNGHDASPINGAAPGNFWRAYPGHFSRAPKLSRDYAQVKAAVRPETIEVPEYTIPAPDLGSYDALSEDDDELECLATSETAVECQA